MIGELGEQAKAERDAIIAEIHVAFANVSRGEHGVSWSECYALDMYEPEDVCAAARRSDKDTHWSELCDDPHWEPFPGMGGFSFIDDRGFRYYLPPTMIRLLRGSAFEWYPGHLLSHIERFVEPRVPLMWPESQLRCVARFVSFMSRHDSEVRRWPEDPNPWADAIAQRWHAYLPK